MGDARIVSEAEPETAHLAPDTDRVVCDVFLIAVAGQIEVVRRGLVDYLAPGQARQDYADGRRKTRALLRGDIDVGEVIAVSKADETEVMLDHRLDRVQSGVVEQACGVGRGIAAAGC